MNRLLLCCALAGVFLSGALSVRSAEPRPGTGPWDVRALQRPVAFQESGSERVVEKLKEDGQVADVPVQLASGYYEGEPLNGKPTRIFAYYARPADSGKKRLPAMVLVHGGGGTAFPQWARIWAARGYAALAMDLGGCGPDRQRLPDGMPDQGDDSKFRWHKQGVKSAWSYHAVAAIMRGVSVLAGMPEVDRKRIGITGISWGGYLTSIVMSLDDRLKVAVPVYGCGFLHENSVWLPVFQQLPEPERRAWVESFEPSRYLPRCRIPVLWMNGTNDFAYPLDSYQKSYRSVRGPRYLCVTVNMPHSHEAGWARPEIYRFADAVLRPGFLPEAYPTVSQPVEKDGKVRLLYRGGTTVARAYLHWTTDTDKPWQQREWKTAPARTVSLDEVEAELPKQRPAVYFLTVEDLRGSVASTEHVTLDR